MKINFTKYEGTGNDFILIDNRNGSYSKLSVKKIAHLCDRRFGIGADGLMLLENLDGFSFKMVYYNADGFASSMCGNGGRCIVAFAKQLGIITDSATFMAVDGEHYAKINADNYVELKMIDVNKIDAVDNDFILNTGSPHLVKITTNLKLVNVSVEGSKIRNSVPYKKEGINVNFIEILNDTLFVRTYERGVENETLSCGTGAVAAALVASNFHFVYDNEILLKTKGGDLKVSFNKKSNQVFNEIWLKGAATKVFDGAIEV